MSTQDPIELLRTIAPALQNGHKETLTQAANLIKQLIAERDELKQALAAQPLPEAITSVTFRMVHKATQTESQFTLRGYSDTELQARLERRISSLVDAGWVASDAYVDQRRVERELNGTPAREPEIPADALTFKAEVIEKSTKGDKTYFKVKGPKFPEFGVTVWPEVLTEAGFNPDTLGGVTNLSGYTATYTLNDKGNPHKVVRLAR